MNLHGGYISKNYLISLAECVHTEDRTWNELMSIIRDIPEVECYPSNWIDSSFIDYNLNDIYKRPYVVALPFRVGDTVYSIDKKYCGFEKLPHKGRIKDIDLNNTCPFVIIEFGDNICHERYTWIFKLDKFGKTLFLNKKDAEMKLNEEE